MKPQRFDSFFFFPPKHLFYCTLDFSLYMVLMGSKVNKRTSKVPFCLFFSFLQSTHFIASWIFLCTWCLRVQNPISEPQRFHSSSFFLSKGAHFIAPWISLCTWCLWVNLKGSIFFFLFFPPKHSFIATWISLCTWCLWVPKPNKQNLSPCASYFAPLGTFLVLFFFMLITLHP